MHNQSNELSGVQFSEGQSYQTRDWRALIAITGTDAASFLQGLLSNDVQQLSNRSSDHVSSENNDNKGSRNNSNSNWQSQYTLLLSPQGKVMYDFFLLRLRPRLDQDDGADASFYLACHPAYRTEIIAKLQMYRLRAAVDVVPVDNWVLQAVPTVAGDETHEAQLPDPRHTALGSWAVVAQAAAMTGTGKIAEIGDAVGEQLPSDEKPRPYLTLRIPQFGVDFFPNEFFPMEIGMEQLGALSYTKGCYVGQEIVTRTKFLGQVRRGVYLLEAMASGDGLSMSTSRKDPPLIPERLAPVMQDERRIGQVIGVHEQGRSLLGLLRLEALELGQKQGQQVEIEVTVGGEPFHVVLGTGDIPVHDVHD